MPGFNRHKVIDSFSSIEAARRAVNRTGGFRSQPSKAELPVVEKRSKDASENDYKDAKIDHTAVPGRYEIECYECGYAFVLTGGLRKTICPKCRETLTDEDQAVDGECSSSVKTIGTVDISDKAVVKDAEIIGGDINLDGNAKEGVIKAFRTLTVGKGAKLNFAHVSMRDLVVGAGASINITRKIYCRNLDIEGKLKGKIFADGTVVIKKGGSLSGEVHAGNLIMEEGGGLKAEVHLNRAEEDKAEEDKEGHSNG